VVSQPDGPSKSDTVSMPGPQHPFRDMLEVQDQDSSPESRLTPTPPSPRTYKGRHFSYLWPLFIALSTALGLASVAIADEASRNGSAYSTAVALFFAGLLLVFVPVAVRVLMRSVDRRERLALIILLGCALYAVKILGSPVAFTFIDEYIHLRNTQDILRTHHLFALNPLLPTAAYYPGLAAVTASLVSLTGLSPFTSGLLIIGAARILICACFFLIAERVTGSDLRAAAASLIYAANPMFLFWSASFSYEDLALPLASFVIWWIARTRRPTGRLAPVVTVVAIVAVTVTHHVAAFALAALLGAWWLAENLTQRPGPRRHDVGLMALVAGSTSLAWFFFVARPAASYLFGQNISPALRQVGSLLFGHSTSRHLYSGGSAAPAWYMLSGFAAVGLIILALPPAVYRAWSIASRRRVSRCDRRGRRGRTDAPMLVVAVVAAAFPLTLLPRLTSLGGAVSSRSSEYVFSGLGCVLALLTEEAVRSRRGKPRTTRVRFPRWFRTLTAAGIVTVIFIGDVTIGTAYSQLLPESSHPQGYPWMVQPDAVSASRWARKHLGINQRFGVDAIDAQALATYGEQDTVSEDVVWPIFLSDTMSEVVMHTIRTAGIRYLFVDWRMTEGLPVNSGGYYFSLWEPQANKYRHPLPAAALRKFASTACASLVYKSGAIQIFDVTRIENGSCGPRTASVTRGESR
jgi:hypothetical protein